MQCKEGDTVQCRLGRGAVAFAWSKASVIISITRGGDKLVVAHGSQLTRTMILITTRVPGINFYLKPS